ncbi:MAG: carboxypeptidase regulatory-like domain-containing protein [Pyrinomonadaceae bacterium]
MKKRPFGFTFLSLCMASFLLFAGAALTFGQATTGSISGTVVDPAGNVVSGATVTAKNEATGVSTGTFTTTGDGTFVFSNLNPGNYSVTVSTASGFKTKTTTGLAVRLGLETPLRVALEVGGASETVTIVASADEIAQTNSEITANFDTRKVSELPSNAAGGGIDTLALNIPGVTPGFGNVNSNGTTLSVNGNRARSNNFTIDGTDNNDLSIGGPSYFVSNTEIVQEFQVVTNNFSAQYGRNQGAIVNIITKGGTNDFSGSAFLYHRNASSLDAMNNIERRTTTRSAKDKFISNTFGFTFGGPIVKNKAFFFGSFQGIRQAQNFTSRGGNLAILPSEFARLRAAFPNNSAINALTTQGAFALTGFGAVRPRVDRAQDKVCISVTATVNCVNGVNETGFFAAAFPEREFALPFTQDEYTVRGDWNITEKDNLRFQYLNQDAVTTNSLGGSNGFTGDVPAKSQNFSGFWNRQISSNIINSFQGTFQRLSVKFGGGCTDPLTGCIPDPAEIGEAYASVNYAGFAGFASGATLQALGGATNLPQGRIVDVYQFSDKVNWNVGSHSLTFGGDIRKLKNSVPFLPNINGVTRYNSIAALSTAIPTSVTLADGKPDLQYTQLDRFFFFQNDWRVKSNLTLNLGVRYEFSGQPINRIFDVTSEREANSATALYRQSLPLEARIVPKLKADSNNFAPRLGFAWSPKFGDGKFAKFLFGENDATVFRGGYSIAYDAVFYNIMLNISTSAPTVILDTFTPTVAMPGNPIGSAMRSAYSANLRRNTFDPRLLSQTDVSSDFHNPYTVQYSFGMQRQINASNVFEIRYVGNLGKDLFQTVNRNPSYASLYNGFTLANFTLGGVTSDQVFPNFRGLLGGAPAPQTCVNDPVTPDNEAACNGRLLAGRGLIRSRTNTGRSRYDSLQTRYNGRFLDKNLNFGASYTFSKALDNASEIFSFGENAVAQNPFDIDGGEYGTSGFDRPHAFSMNFIYDVPLYRDQQGFAGKMLGGWQINGTYNLASGRNYTPEQFRNSQVFANSYIDGAFANTFIGLDNLRPFVGNINADPTRVGITNLDARLMGLLGPTTALSSTGFYLLNDLNRIVAGSRVLTPVTANDVRFIYNGPGAARQFGTPFGTAGRNSVKGIKLNQMNMGLFKTTSVTERIRVQFRAEAFNVLNTPTSGFGVAAGASIPDLISENAGVTYGNPFETALSSRRLQFGLRILF